MGTDCHTSVSTVNGENAFSNKAKLNAVKSTSKRNGVKNKETKFHKNLEAWKYSRIWAILCLTVFPVALLAVHVSCSKGSCSVSEFPPFPCDVRSYVNYESAAVYFGWLAIQFILFIIPIGSKTSFKSSDEQILTARLNGPFACLFTYFAMFVSIKYGFSYEVVTKNFLSLHVLTIICSLLLALCLQITSSNKNHQKQSWIFRLANGTNAQPIILNFDLKRFLIRISLLSWGALGFAIQATEFHSPRGLHPSNTLVTLIHVYFAAEAVCLEDTLLTSILYRYDKVGFQFIYGCLTAIPVLFTITLRYTAEQQLPMTEFAVVSRFFLCVPGYCLYRGSLSDKTLFSKSPDSIDFHKSSVIRGENGKAIFADGFWAFSRNPNYLGILILALNWLSPGFDGIYISSCSIVAVIYLLNRAFSIDFVNFQLFGKIWSSYCQKVKFRIIKHIF